MSYIQCLVQSDLDNSLSSYVAISFVSIIFCSRLDGLLGVNNTCNTLTQERQYHEYKKENFNINLTKKKIIICKIKSVSKADR